MHSPGVWFATIAGICGGSMLYMRRYGKRPVRKPLMMGLWAAAVVGTIISVVAIWSGS